MPIEPFSPIGFVILAIFAAGIVLIILEVRLAMDKFMWATGEGPERFQALKIMKFLPAVLAGFFASFAAWYLQFEWLRP
jgi:hypothetical protein